jgi:hypothetical protein
MARQHAMHWANYSKNSIATATIDTGELLKIPLFHAEPQHLLDEAGPAFGL